MKKFTDKKLALSLSAASLGVSGANLAINSKRQKEGREYQEKQLEAMDRLTKSLDGVNTTMSKPKETKKIRLIRFIQKSNSEIPKMAAKGAAMGAALTGIGIPFLPKKPEDSPKFLQKTNPYYRGLLLEVGGTIIGGILGAFAGAIKDLSTAVNRKSTVNNRLLKDVLVALKKMGFQEGRDYTRDPKVASLLKTKVCLVISKSSDELKLLINTVSDEKLKKITKDILGNLPTMSTVTEKVSDRFNELNITTMTSNNGDATWVASVTEKFIRSSYPVYLIEVG